MDEKFKNILEKLKNRSPEEEEKSRIEYCKDSISDKKFKLVKWKQNQKDWSHDHCDFCGKHISDKEGGETEAYTNNNEDWLCKDCFKRNKEELGLIEIK